MTLYFVPEHGELIDRSERTAQKFRPLPDTAQRLAELVLRKDFPFEHGDYTCIPPGEWDQTDVTKRTRLFESDIAEYDPRKGITREIANRLHTLGLYPHYVFFERGYSSEPLTSLRLTSLSRRATIHPNLHVRDKTRNRAYDQMQLTELVEQMLNNYNRHLEPDADSPFDGPFSTALLTTMYNMGLGPNPYYLMRRFGDMTKKINATLGFPDTDSWQKDDYLDYGAQVIYYNGMDKLSQPNIKLLSSFQVGPSLHAIAKYFTWKDYIYQSVAAFSSSHSRPGNNMNRRADTSYHEARTHAVHELVNHFFPRKQRSQIRLPDDIDRNSIQELVRTIHERTGTSLVDIEHFALTVNIFDDLWSSQLIPNRLPIISEYAAKKSLRDLRHSLAERSK